MPTQACEPKPTDRTVLASTDRPLPSGPENLLAYPFRLAKARIYAHCVIDGEPMSKHRPRFVRKTGTVFTPRETRDRERLIGWEIKKQMRQLVRNDTNAFGVRAAFYLKNSQRKDLDNMMKLVFDAATGVVWKDDKQVKEMFGWSFENEAVPRTELVIYVLPDIEVGRKGVPCRVCGRSCPVYPSWKTRQFCSHACQGLASRNGLDLPCANCGSVIHKAKHELVRLKKRFVYCSMACKSEHGSRQLRCDHCGGEFRRPVSLIKKGRQFCSATCCAASKAARKKGPPEAR